MTRPLLRLATPVCLAVLLTACAADGPDGDGAPSTGSAGGDDRQLELIASFYPLQFLAERVAGDHARVSTLTAPGIDPHDLELTPRAMGSMGSADLVVYQSGLQPAVDEAVRLQATDHAFDVTPVADLLALGETEQDHAGADAGAASADGHDHGAEDPHFWLDPDRYGDVALALADRLASLDPTNAADYTAGAAALVADLETLDGQFRSGLAACESRDLVTTHEAFGYLAHRYQLDQIGITGLSPESEPSPARLAEVTAQVRQTGVSTIYAEPIVTDAIARTVAQETGAEVLVLDPVEGITDGSAGTDYLAVMRANLEALRQGQGCS